MTTSYIPDVGTNVHIAFPYEDGILTDFAGTYTPRAGDNVLLPFESITVKPTGYFMIDTVMF